MMTAVKMAVGDIGKVSPSLFHHHKILLAQLLVLNIHHHDRHSDHVKICYLIYMEPGGSYSQDLL